MISPAERAYILTGVSQNFRPDGRPNLQARPYTLLHPPSNPTAPPALLSNGSSRLLLPQNTTNILCSIKSELVHPAPQSPRAGIVDLTIDLLPYSCTNSADRRVLKKKQQSTTEVLRGLMIPYLCDLEELCVLPNKYVWRVNIDVVVLACDGNLVDACSWAIWGAVQNWTLPKVDAIIGNEGSKEQDYTTQSKSGPKVTDELLLDGDVTHSIVPKGIESCPIVITVCLMPKLNSTKEAKAAEQLDIALNSEEGGTSKSRTCHRIPPQRKQGDAILVTDPTLQEQECSSTQVSFGIDKDGLICGIHQYGGGSWSGLGGGCNKGTMPYHMMQSVSNVAVAMAKKVRTLLIGHYSDKEASLAGNRSEGTRLIQGNFFQSQFELQ